MKTYQIRLFEVEGNTFDADKAQLTDIIEFTLQNPQPGNVFGILSQWEEQGKALDAVEAGEGNAEAQRIPETIRLADASGLTVRVTVHDERFTRTVRTTPNVSVNGALKNATDALNKARRTEADSATQNG